MPSTVPKSAAIFCVENYESKFYDTEDHDDIASEVILKLQLENRKKRNLTGIVATQSLDPTLISILVARPDWYESRPLESLFLIVVAIVVDLIQSFVAFQLYFDDFKFSTRIVYNILLRGLDNPSFQILRILCMALLCIIVHQQIIQSVGNFLLQIYALKSLSYRHFMAPIASGLTTILDWFTLIASLLTSLTIMSEVTTKSNDGPITIIIAFVSLYGFIHIRSLLPICIIQVLEVLVYNDSILSDAVSFLNRYELSGIEKTKLGASRGYRLSWILACIIPSLLISAWIMYELNCPGVYQNCF